MESKIYETIDDEVVVTDTKAGGTVESPKSGERLVDYRNATIRVPQRPGGQRQEFVAQDPLCRGGNTGGRPGACAGLRPVAAAQPSDTGTAPLAGHRVPGLPAAAGPFGGRKPALRAEGHRLKPETGSQIVDLLHRLSDQGTGVIMATHNMQMVEDFPARVLRCENKSLI